MPYPDDQARQAAERATNAELVARMLTEIVRRWSGFRFRLHCPSCRENREIEVTIMVGRGYGNLLMSQVVDRFKCQVCGQPPDEVTLRHHVAVWVIRGDFETMRSY